MYGRETYNTKVLSRDDLCDVRPRDVHPLGELSLVNAQLLHPSEYAAKEGRADMVDCGHWDLTM